ncbi:NAD-P-binding protein [Lenzites betulinus]|nr:NAD-P-binding protein [Lenzites betulinus]
MSIPHTTREYRIPDPSGVHNLTLTSAPIPALKEHEVLIKVHAVSLQFRDINVVTDTYPQWQKENPVPGSDCAGEIVALGAEVSRAHWAVGDRVSSAFGINHIFGEANEEMKNSGLGGPVDGVLTEYKVLPEHALVRVPEHLSYEEAATLPCAAVTAYNSLMGGPNPLKGGDVVLVQGTGGVSIFGLQLAVASGASVIVTSSSDEKLKLAKKLGATHTINYKTTPDWDEEALKFTNGRGVDHILEIGGPGTLMKSANAIRYGGVISVIGYLAGQNCGDVVALLPIKLLSKAIIMRGIIIGSRTLYENMNRLISAVKMHPVIDRLFAFEDLREAYEYLLSQKHVGKIVIKVSKD